MYPADASTATDITPLIVGLTTNDQLPSAAVLAVPSASTRETPLTTWVSRTGREAPATGTEAPATVRVRVPEAVTESPW